MKSKTWENLLILLLLLALVVMFVVSSHKHTYGEWVVEKEANCIAAGKKVCVCKCGETDTEILKKLSHTDGEWIIDKEPSCTENGSMHQICSVCGETIKTEKTTNLGDHNYQISSMENNGLVGSKITYKCANCSDTYEKTVDEIDISIQYNGTSSSSTINGYGSYSKFYVASASGGYGNYEYKFEIFASDTANNSNTSFPEIFFNDNSCIITYTGYENMINGYILQITVKDSAGNQAIYRYEL